MRRERAIVARPLKPQCIETGSDVVERQRQSQSFLYLDTSALVKLLVREAESEAIEVELLRWSKLATSLVANAESAATMSP